MAAITIPKGDQFTRIVDVPSLGTDAAGADAYATVLTSPNDGRVRTNITAVCATNPAIVSVDAGTTDHIYVPAGVQVTLKDVNIQPNTAIQAKNGSAGNNYATLYIAIW